MLLQSHSAASFLPLGIFGKKQVFFPEKSINLWWKNYISNVSRSFVFSVAFHGILHTFSDFQKAENLFSENPCFFKQPNFCTFSETSLSQSFFTANFLRWNFSGSKKIQYFLSKNPTILFEKPIFLTMKKFIISVAFCSKVATFNDFLKCEISLEKPRNFLNKVTFWTFLKNLLIPSHITANWQHLAILDNLSYFSREARPYFKKGNIGTLWAILLSQSIFRQNFLHLTSSRFQMFC